MKAQKFNLTAATVTTYGDTTKTFLTTKIQQRTVDGQIVLSPPKNIFLPVFDDFGINPNQVMIGNNRIFVMAAIAAGLGRVCLYDIDPNTGTASPVGSLNLTFINSPATTHTIRGCKVHDGADASVLTGWRIFVATTGTVAANGGTYMAMSIARTDFTAVPGTIPTATLADSKQVYKLENSPFTLTAAAGLILDRTNTRCYTHNGVSATHQYYKFNYSLSTGVPGANGITTTQFEFVTGNLPALVGTLLLTNSENYAVPTASPNPLPLLGLPCAFFSTNSTFYLGLLSDLTNGGTTWPSLTPGNNVDTTHLNAVPTHAAWSNQCDRLFGAVSSTVFFQKPLQNNIFDKFFGKSTARFWETGYYTQDPSFSFGVTAMSNLQAGLGYLFLVSTTAGTQRGVVCLPVCADEFFGTEYLISPVLNLGDALSLEFINVVSQLNSISGNVRMEYRTTGFGSQSGNWLAFPESFSGIGLSAGAQIQIKILFRIYNEWTNQTQFTREAYIAYNGRYESIDNYEYSKDQSSSTSPTRVAWRQKDLFALSVPNLRFVAYDLSGVSLINHTTSGQPAQWEYSTNNGVSWLPLGTIPNVVGTLIRYTFLSPPGVDIRPTLTAA